MIAKTRSMILDGKPLLRECRSGPAAPCIRSRLGGRAVENVFVFDTREKLRDNFFLFFFFNFPYRCAQVPFGVFGLFFF